MQATFKSKGMEKVIPCTPDCQYRTAQYCRMSGRFFFLIPKVDMMSAFMMRTSHNTTLNIIGALKRMVGQDGKIGRQSCTIHERPSLLSA